uniref:UDP-glucoronosyl/UDP-glucosyl transferase family protein n=1 Tax=Populus alba TaxID=43335 RepID=A0A4U5R0Q4_POPAL|nr:UDP-glucoronosyl/UDP-glucosyl transferase family protein [Populus alba]
MKNSGTDIQVDERNGRRLVLFPLPLQGHVNPMIQLANILHSKGFSITIIHTTFNSPDPSKYPHFTFHSIQEELTETEASTADIIALASSLNIKCVAPFRDCVSRLLSDVSEDPIACLISDAIFHFTAAVSKGLKLPRIVLRTGGASSFRIFTALPFLKEKGYLPIQESQLEEPMVELPPFKVKDLPVINSRDPESVYDLMVSMADGTKASSGVIWNTFEELEQSALAALRHEFSIPIFPIGPFHNRFPSSSRFSITIIHTQFNAPNPSKCPHFTFHEIPDGLLEDEASTADGVILFSVLNSKCVEPFRDSLANLLLDAMDQEPVACLITDAAWHFTHAVAEGFKIPTIAMRTTSICSFLAFASFPLLREKGYFPIQDSRLEESVQELPPLKVKDLPVIITRFPATLHQLFEKISNQAKACSGLIWNSFEEIERDALSKLSQRMVSLKEKVNLCIGHGGSSYHSLESLTNYIMSF